MRHILIIVFIFLFSLTIYSCSSSSDDGSSTTTDNDTTSNDNTTTTDTTAPVIAEVTAVTTPTNDTTPNYTFSSDEAGTITYGPIGGFCSSSTTSATTGNNTITLLTFFGDEIYSGCTINVTDSAGNVSNTLTITSFTVICGSGCFVAVGNSGTILRDSLVFYGSSFDIVTSPSPMQTASQPDFFKKNSGSGVGP